MVGAVDRKPYLYEPEVFNFVIPGLCALLSGASLLFYHPELSLIAASVGLLVKATVGRIYPFPKQNSGADLK